MTCATWKERKYKGVIDFVNLVLGAVLFVVAFFMGGVHFDQAGDLGYLGLAAFCTAHLPWGSVGELRRG